MIRAAKDWGLRPTEVIMKNPDFGHHCPATGKVVGSGWTHWDYSLVQALQSIEDHTDQNGLLVWEKDAENVEVEALKKVDRFQAAVDRITKQDKYKPLNGEYWVPRVQLRYGEWPTRREYYKQLAEERADVEDEE